MHYFTQFQANLNINKKRPEYFCHCPSIKILLCYGQSIKMWQFAPKKLDLVSVIVIIINLVLKIRQSVKMPSNLQIEAEECWQSQLPRIDGFDFMD